LIKNTLSHGMNTKPIGLANQYAVFLYARANYTQAEPLYRRALCIDEANFGPDHPRVAIDLNNLALLLKATNRLSDAEPLSRRVVEILQFTAATSHEHPHLSAAIANYSVLLEEMGRSPAQIRAQVEELRSRAAADHAKYRSKDHAR
jgi:tetratricopeptide (TPR) repeat protein